MSLSNKNIFKLFVVSISFLAGNSASAQYYSNYNSGGNKPKIVGNRPKTGYTSNAAYYNNNRNFGNPYTNNNQQYNNVYHQQPQAQQYKPAPIFVINNTQRMTNPIPGYGEVQNPYAAASSSGFYIGLGYMNAKDKGGGFISDIEDEFIPGNWHEDGNSLGKGTGFSLSVGTQTSGDRRSELSYNSYSGFQYADFAKGANTIEQNADGQDVEVPKEFQRDSGGGLEIDSFMFNTYYSLENMLGSFFNGTITPYAGFGFGLGFSKISDYTLKDENGFVLDSAVGDETMCFTELGSTIPCADIYTNGEIEYQGNSANNFSWNYEIGLSFDAGDNVMLDVFYRKSMYGELSTSGSATSTYNLAYEVDPATADANGIICNETNYCYLVTYDDGSQYYSYDRGTSTVKESATESADIEIEEVGIKLRTFF